MAIWLTWITVTLSESDRYPLALSFAYDRATIDALQDVFGRGLGLIRWNPESRCWLLRRSQWSALVALCGDRLSAAPEVWRFVYPPKQVRHSPARQLKLHGVLR